jgi:hypothetical protein
MPTLPALPVELWSQILSYVVTLTRPIAIEGWDNNDSMPVLKFAPEDADIQRSFTLLTGPQAIDPPFPICEPESWRQLVSQSRWLLKRDTEDIYKLFREHWPYARHATLPYACDLSRLQTTFTASVKHVEIVMDEGDYWMDGYFNDEKVSYALGSENQWAYAATEQILAVLKTCTALKSLRVYLDAYRDSVDFDRFYRSWAFTALWDYTSPWEEYGNERSPIAWKEECRRRGIDFKIIARIARKDKIEEEDLTEFWDLPEYVKADEGEMYGHDKGLSWAIEANDEARSRRRV